MNEHVKVLVFHIMYSNVNSYDTSSRNSKAGS